MLQRIFIGLLLLCTLSSCSYIKKHNLTGNQADVYQKAEAGAPLKMPASLPNNIIGSKTETLPTQITAQPLPEIPAPPGSLAATK